MKRMDIVNALVERGFKGVETQESVKNGIVVEGIVIRNGNPIAPIIYTDRLIRDAEAQGKSLSDVVETVIRIYEENKTNRDLEFSKLFDKGFIRNHVYLGIQKESTEELLKEKCYLEGLETYLYVRAESEHDGMYSMKLNRDFIEKTGMNEQELWDNAKINTYKDIKVRTMSEIISEMCGIPYDELTNGYGEISTYEPTIYVVSNNSMMRGASAILDKTILEDIGRKHGTDTLIILPSSIHEVLIVPYEDRMDMDDMRAMVREVNATEVLPEDQLISDAYKVTVTI